MDYRFTLSVKEKKEMSISTMFQALKKGAEKNSPVILTAIGVTGLISAGVMAVRATPKALILIEEEKTRINAEIDREARIQQKPVTTVVVKLKPKDVVKVTWKCYIPAVVTGALAVGCIVWGSSINLKRNAALATAYGISEATLKDYQKKVVETIGEKKEKEIIRDSIAEDTLKEHPVENNEVIVTGKGDILCFDTISGRYFKSTIDLIKKIENNLNRRMRDEMYIPLNDLYYEIGLEPVCIGNDVGWNIDRGYLDISFSSKIATNGEPCAVLNYSVTPRYDFDSWG